MPESAQVEKRGTAAKLNTLIRHRKVANQEPASVEIAFEVEIVIPDQLFQRRCSSFSSRRLRASMSMITRRLSRVP